MHPRSQRPRILSGRHAIEATLSALNRTPLAARTTRLLVMWLLALVLPLQGAAVGVFGVKGPVHQHQTASAPPLVLQDVRRWKAAPVKHALQLALRGHVHAGSASQRHHHARSDPSVLVTAIDAPDADEAIGPSGLSVLALIPTSGIWCMAEPVSSSGAAASGRFQTRCVSPLDRPPKASA